MPTLDRDRDHTLDQDHGIQSDEIDDLAVTTAKLADGAITNIKVNASAGIDLSKLATDPLARANHTGSQLASTISDFDTQVRTSRLDQMAIPTATVNFNGQTITNTGILTLPTATTTLIGNDTTDTLTNKTFDADGIGNSITNIENADIKVGAAIDLSKLATDPLARANHTGSQLASTISDFATAVGSSTSTLTNKTFDANGTGNSITNIENADISASAGIVVTKLANGTANQIIKTNSGGTALEYGLIADANIDTGANITITKIANGTANQVVKTNAGGTALEFGTLANDNLASGVFSNITGIGTQAQTLDMNANLIDNVSDIAVGLISDETNTVTAITIADTTGLMTFETDVTFADAQNITFNSTTGTQIGTATTEKLAFYGDTPIVQPTALTTALTTITFVDENTPDFALSSLTTTSPAGFATLDEAQGFVEAVANIQTRVNELETKLQSLGLIA